MMAHIVQYVVDLVETIKLIYMKKLLILLGLANQPAPTTITDVKFMSTYPENRPDLHDWCKEFRFGMLYDRRIIHMN
jgi:hypothetical protein